MTQQGKFELRERMFAAFAMALLSNDKFATLTLLYRIDECFFAETSNVVPEEELIYWEEALSMSTVDTDLFELLVQFGELSSFKEINPSRMTEVAIQHLLRVYSCICR